MSTRVFLTNLALIGAAMALLTVVETVAPLFVPAPASRGRRAANLGLTAATRVLNWALTCGAAVIALALSLQRPGLMARLGMSPAAQLFASVVVLDFSFGYVAHRTMHASPALWRVHRVHHSDPFVDVTTTYRMHPIEGLWRFLFLVAPVWLLGVPAQAVVAHRALSALNGILEHANVRLWRPLDHALSLVWVTPGMHKVHHSRAQVETDSNYGNVLAVYDRLLRTFTPTARAAAVAYGLDDADPGATSLLGLLAMPFAAVEAGAPPEAGMPVARRHS